MVMKVREVRAVGNVVLSYKTRDWAAELRPLVTQPINSGVLLHQELRGDGCHQDLVMDGDDNPPHAGCR